MEKCLCFLTRKNGTIDLHTRLTVEALLTPSGLTSLGPSFFPFLIYSHQLPPQESRGVGCQVWLSQRLSAAAELAGGNLRGQAGNKFLGSKDSKGSVGSPWRRGVAKRVEGHGGNLGLVSMER